MPRPGGDNPAGIMVYTNTLKVIGNTRSEYTGNIFTLVMKIKGVNFPKALNYIAEQLGIEDNSEPIELPFGGFFKYISNPDTEYIPKLLTYKESDLPNVGYLSKKFVNDNISLLVQEDWGVRYDDDDDAILIPIYFNNELVGCKARSNKDNVDFNKRWWAYLPYKKTQVVYGFDKNYASIIEENKCIITESEKGVLQLASMDINIGLAIGGHSISTIQSRYIRSIGVSEIIIAFDEDVSEEEVIFEGKKLKELGILENKVSYIYNYNGILLPKESPTDKSYDELQELLAHRKVIK